MIAFGGCGPMHAVRIARKLGVPRVILPASAGVMSALGLLISPLSFETVRSLRMDLAALDKSSLQAAFRPLVDQVSGFLEQAGVRRNSIRVVRKLDMRYEGQGHEIEVSLPEDGDHSAVREAFDRSYRSLFSSFLLHEPLEIINWKVEAFAPRVSEHDRFAVADTKLGGEPVKGRRDAYFPEASESRACEVYDRYLLAPGMRIDGPALIEERESTCVIGPGDSCEVDGHRNLLIDVGREDAARCPHWAESLRCGGKDYRPLSITHRALVRRRVRRHDVQPRSRQRRHCLGPDDRDHQRDRDRSSAHLLFQRTFARATTSRACCSTGRLA
jgi:N-methylhydantoinase A